MSQSPLRLLDDLSAALQWAVGVLDRRLPRADYRMGGGSVLAAYWRHRRSTDVDLFFNHRAVHDGSFNSIVQDLRRMDEDGEVADLRLYTHGATWTRRSTPVSLFAAERIAFDGIVRTIEDVGVPAEPPAEILAKKVRARMLHSQQYLARDMYDFLVAHVEDPAAVTRVFECLTREEREMLRHDAANARFPDDAGRSIIEPAYPELAESSRAFAHAMRLALEGKLAGRDLDRLRDMRIPFTETPAKD